MGGARSHRSGFENIMTRLRIGITSMAVGSCLATALMYANGVHAHLATPLIISLAAAMSWLPWERTER